MTTPHHVGLMVPINNTTMENELVSYLPAQSTCQTKKIPRGQGMLTRDTIPAYKAQALEIAQQFDIKKILPLYEALYHEAINNSK